LRRSTHALRSARGLLAALDLGAGHLIGSDKCIDARLGKRFARPVHAHSERRGLDAAKASVRKVGGAGKHGENDHGNDELHRGHGRRPSGFPAATSILGSGGAGLLQECTSS
jgi:hypothetical protein